MNYELKEDKILNLLELKAYSIENISALLNCGTNNGKLIRDTIIQENNLKIYETKYITIPKDLLFNYIEKNKSLKESLRREYTVSAILKKSFLNVSDIKILLNCSRDEAGAILIQIKTDMIKKNLIPLEEHILTKYFLKYVEETIKNSM